MDMGGVGRISLRCQLWDLCVRTRGTVALERTSNASGATDSSGQKLFQPKMLLPRMIPSATSVRNSKDRMQRDDYPMQREKRSDIGIWNNSKKNKKNAPVYLVSSL